MHATMNLASNFTVMLRNTRTHSQFFNPKTSITKGINQVSACMVIARLSIDVTVTHPSIITKGLI